MKRKASTGLINTESPLPDVTFDIFKTFFMCKAFDVIGQGTYKPYIIKCKENNDKWAIEAHHAVNVIMESIKRVLGLLYKVQSLPNSTLSNICKETVGNTTPPTAASTEWGTCHISGEHSKDCVRLNRSSGRGGETVHIHKKYFRFIKFLWYTTKIEHVIRSLTRNWLDQNPESMQDLNTSMKCQRFEAEFSDIRKHHELFRSAVKHIELSFESYIKYYVFNIPLQLELEEEPLKKNPKKEHQTPANHEPTDMVTHKQAPPCSLYGEI